MQPSHYLDSLGFGLIPDWAIWSANGFQAVSKSQLAPNRSSFSPFSKNNRQPPTLSHWFLTCQLSVDFWAVNTHDFPAIQEGYVAMAFRSKYDITEENA
jgi:hypothetical protein